MMHKETHLENLKKATLVTRNSLLIVIGLVIIKSVGGYLTNIIALFGDALGSFSDIIALSAIFVGLKLSQQEASKTFKYGYHRIETIISLCISVLILYAGGKILVESFDRFFVKAETQAHVLGIVAAIISVALSLFTYFYQRTIAKNIGSNALRASAYDKRNDAFVSLGVLVGVVADKFQIPYIEGGVGMIISGIIIWSGVITLKDAFLYLLDHWDEPKVTAKIKSLLKKSKIVTAVKNIRLRHAGTYIFGEAFLEINPFTDSKDLRDEIHRLNREIEKNVEHLGDLVLYIDPPKPTLVRVAIPITNENGLASRIAENPAEFFSFFFVEIKNEKIRKSFGTSETFTVNKSTEIAEFLKNQKVNILISSLIQPILYYNLRLNNIKVYPHFLDVKDVGNTVKLLLLDI